MLHNFKVDKYFGVGEKVYLIPVTNTNSLYRLLNIIGIFFF